jgi:homoserine O-succinyltransferase
MPLLVSDEFHLTSALEELNVRCLRQAEMWEQDIRTLRIGIVNLMPQAESYEFNLLLSLGRTQLKIEPVWIRLNSHTYQSSDERHFSRHYVTFAEAISRTYLDGLILTGAPVEEIPFQQVKYWNELRRILTFARMNIASTIGLCWGAMALAHLIGIEKISFQKKLFGVFETRNLDRAHQLMSETDDLFWCPQSRYAGFTDEVLELAEKQGKINLLAHSSEAGYVIFETKDHCFLMHLGHPEYNSHRLVDEALRDQGLNRSDVEPPRNFDIARPVNCWRGHRATFFSRWTNYLYETTSCIYTANRV